VCSNRFAGLAGSFARAEFSPSRKNPNLCTRVLLRYDAVIDKLIGDEVMAFFVRSIGGADYRRRAVVAEIGCCGVSQFSGNRWVLIVSRSARR
jgi:hypothetical protein